jgi:hypothetical protein
MIPSNFHESLTLTQKYILKASSICLIFVFSSTHFILQDYLNVENTEPFQVQFQKNPINITAPTHLNFEIKENKKKYFQ